MLTKPLMRPYFWVGGSRSLGFHDPIWRAYDVSNGLVETTNQTTFEKHPHLENTNQFFVAIRGKKMPMDFFVFRIEVENKLLGDPIEVAALRSIVTRLC